MSKESNNYKNSPKKVYIRTFGCQMNEYDSELIRGLFEKEGYVYTGNMEEADVVLFNTCSVREHAEARVWGQVGMLRKFTVHSSQCTVQNGVPRPDSAASGRIIKDGGAPRPTKKIIGLVGCMAQNYRERIFEKLPHVNLVCGTGNIYDLPQLVKEARETDTQILAVEGKQRPHAIGSAGVRKGSLKAFVTIIEGCDNYCSYCIVPYVRGGQVSRLPEEIIQEVKSLVENGTKEVTLLGQNVNSYAGDVKGSKTNFVKLLLKISKIRGLERIRFTTNHPKDTNIEIFKLMAENKKICPHLHMPLQSGSDRILKMMNRKYKVSDYRRLADLYRKFVEGASLTTDIVVGFPTEKEEDFKATFDTVKEIGFDSAFIFKYSPRPPAVSSLMEDDVPMVVKKQRNQLLLELQKKISLNKNRFCLGKEEELLVEGYDKAKKKLIGRTRTNKIAVFDGGDELIGELVRVEIKDVTENTLIAGMI